MDEPVPEETDEQLLARWPHLAILSPDALRWALEVLEMQLALPDHLQHQGVINMVSRPIKEHDNAVRARAETSR